jgi:hypothetical protein
VVAVGTQMSNLVESHLYSVDLLWCRFVSLSESWCRFVSLSECISSCSLPTSTFPKPGLVLYVLCITVDIRRSGAVLSIVVASAASVLWRLRIWFLEIQEFSLSTPEILSP